MNTRSFYFGLFVLITITIPKTAFCQYDYKPGFIITNDYDTVHGYLNIRPNYKQSQTCEFSKDQISAPTGYTPSEIRAYRIENEKFYVSRELEVDGEIRHVFLEYMVDGIVDLFYLKDLNHEYYFIEKDTIFLALTNNEMRVVKRIDDDPLVYSKTSSYFKREYSVNSKKYLGVLNYLFHDSPEIKSKINTTRFEYKSLLNITKDYHSSICTDYECIDYTRTAKSAIYIEPQIGYIFSKMGMKTASEYTSNIKPALGVNLRYGYFKIHYLWNFGIGLHLSSNDFTGDYIATLYNNTPTKHRLYTKYTILRIPLYIQYSMPYEKFQPYIFAGYQNILLVGTDYFASRFYSESQVTGTMLDERIRHYQIGLTGGLGVRCLFKENRYFFLKGSCEYRMPSANLDYMLDFHHVKSINVDFGLGFKL